MNRPQALSAKLALGFLGAVLAGSAMADARAEVAIPPASIPFANLGGIYNWEADRERGLWVQASNRQWYYATLAGPCQGLDFAHAVAFDTGPIGTLDRWSSVVVPQWGKCMFMSFEPSQGPPKRRANS